MFESIKGKIQAVKQDINASLQTLRIKRSTSQNNYSTAYESFVNVCAGAELLHKYEQCWHQMHMLTNENAECANAASHELRRLGDNVTHQAEQYKQFNRELYNLPKLSDELSNLVADTAKLDSLCQEVESALCYLDVLCQTQDMENLKLEQRFQLALYREKKMAALNDVKVQMSLDYTKRKEEKDKMRRSDNLEKQNLLQQAAENDLKVYKATGCITNSLVDDWAASGIEEGDISVADLLTNHMESRKAMQLTYFDDQHFSNLSQNSSDGLGPEPPNGFGPEPADRDLSALEEFLAEIKLEDSGIVGDNVEETS